MSTQSSTWLPPFALFAPGSVRPPGADRGRVASASAQSPTGNPANGSCSDMLDTQSSSAEGPESVCNRWLSVRASGSAPSSGVLDLEHVTRV